MIKDLRMWIADVYTKHGYVAVLVVIAVIVALILLVSYATGYDVASIANWIGEQ